MTREEKFDSVAKASAIAVLEDELKIRSVVYAEHLSHGGKADCGEEFYLDALNMAIAALREQEKLKPPCELCRYNPPSSSDGKPCTMCPATPKEEV